jgi:hypothetical protein
LKANLLIRRLSEDNANLLIRKLCKFAYQKIMQTCLS